MTPEYILADPTGNITILVRTPVTQEYRAEIARLLMEREPSAEQVGFLSPGDEECDITLNMAGGEFCGNASLCAGAMWCMEQRKNAGEVRVRVSGAKKIIPVTVRKTAEYTYRGTVGMPLPVKISEEMLNLDGEIRKFPVVFFEGITHVISEREISPASAERAAEDWCAVLGADALGILQVNLENKSILPLIYVRDAKTLFWESSCASGTAAVGAYLYEMQKTSVDAEFSEPAGTLRIEAGEGSLKMTGNVRFL